MDVVLRLCSSCAGAQAGTATRLRQALADAGLPASVSDVDCLDSCQAPLALSLQGRDRASYVFAGLSLPEDEADVVATCRAYLNSPAGWIEDARPCGRLRFCLRARVPAGMR